MQNHPTEVSAARSLRRAVSAADADAGMAQGDLLALLGNSGTALASAGQKPSAPSGAVLLHALRRHAAEGGALSLSKCGTGLIPGQHAGLYREATGDAKLRGVTRCKNGALCPVCAPAVAAARYERLTTALRERGGRMLLICLTFEHSASDSIRGAVATLFDAWRLLMQGRWWREQVGAAFSRGFDFTIGRNGPHPHFHLVVFAPPGEPDLEAFGREFLAEWERACAVFGRAAPAYAQDAQVVRSPGKAARYCIKATATTVSEVVSPVTKSGRNGGATIGDLVRAITRGGDAGRAAGRVFVELCRALKGRQAVATSRSLRVDLNDLSGVDVAPVRPDAEPVAFVRCKSAMRLIWANIRPIEAAVKISAAECVVALTGLLGPPDKAGAWYLPDET